MCWLYRLILLVFTCHDVDASCKPVYCKSLNSQLSYIYLPTNSDADGLLNFHFQTHCYYHTYSQHYSSDAAIKQYIKFLDEHNLLGKKFILHDLDDVHLFVAGDVARKLQEKLDELMERNSYSEFGQEVQGQRVRKE